MANEVALVLVSGQPRRIAAADSLMVGVGIKSTAGTGLAIGQVSELTTLKGNVQIDGTVTLVSGTVFQDDVELGNDPTDDITFGGSVVTDIYFKHTSPTVLHTISGRAPTSDTGTGGNNILIKAAAGAVAVTTNDGGTGGSTTFNGGSGGIGSATKPAGAGGKLIACGGTAGAAAAGGGNNGAGIELDGGAGSGAGTHGTVALGTKSTAGGSYTSAVLIGRTGINTTVQGALIVDEATHLHGAVQLGDSTADDVSFDGLVVGNISFKHQAATVHSVTGTAPAANTGTAGNDVTLASATGAAAGATTNGGVGGYTTVESGIGGAGSATNNGGDGGDTTVKGGVGGIGSSQTAGAGGKLILNGGNAGTAGTVGGNSGGRVEIDGGLATGAGVSGDVWIGTNGSTEGVDIGRSTKDTSVLGNLIVAEQAHLHGTVQLGDASTDDVTFDGSVTDSVYFKHQGATDHLLVGRAPAADSGTGGNGVYVYGATGAAAGVTNAGSQGGPSGMYGGTGGVCSATLVAGPGGTSATKGGLGGAGSATRAAGKGGDASLLGGTGGPDNTGVGGSGGDCWVDGGQKTGSGTTGALYVGIDYASVVTIGRAAAPLTLNGNSVALQEAGSSALVIDGGLIEVKSGFELQCASGGMIDLPLNFKINNLAVSNNVTRANLDELTGAGVTALHSHAGGAASNAFINVTCNATTQIEAGAPVTVYNVGGSPKGAMAYAEGATPLLENAIGIAPAIIAINATGAVYTSGEVAVPNGRWFGSVPAVGDVGKKVYLSAANAGDLTLTAPNGADNYVLKVGIITVGGTGAVKMAIQIGDSFLI